MRSRAVALKACACTVETLGQLAAGEDLDRDPLARAEAGAAQRLERDLRAGLEAGLEVGMLTGWVWVRNGSNGIDCFLCGPRSLRIRMWIGIWPPSKRARSFAPEREP